MFYVLLLTGQLLHTDFYSGIVCDKAWASSQLSFFLITMPIVRHSIKFQGINFVLGFWVVVLLLLGVMGQGMNNNKSSIQFKASQHLSILCTVNKKAQDINVQWCQATAPPTASLPGNVLQFVSVNYVKIN